MGASNPRRVARVRTLRCDSLAQPSEVPPRAIAAGSGALAVMRSVAPTGVPTTGVRGHPARARGVVAMGYIDSVPAARVPIGT